MRAAGFARASWQSLSGGIVALHSGCVCDFCTDSHRAAGPRRFRVRARGRIRRGRSEPGAATRQLALRIARLVERPGAKSGPHLSRALTRLGPAYLKLGQFLATRPDVVGVIMARDLESLQDRLPPFSQSEAEAAIALSLERPVAQAFASFGPAVAAASIAQVHRGETSGTACVPPWR